MLPGARHRAPTLPGLWPCAASSGQPVLGGLGLGELSYIVGLALGTGGVLFSFSVGFLWHVNTSLTHPELPIDGFCLLSAPVGTVAAPLQFAARCMVPVRGAGAALGNDS